MLKGDFNTDSDNTDRGVSPVIGVILMVAITVILAAVIGTFVLNLSSKTGNVGPQTTFTVRDADHDYDPTSTSSWQDVAELKVGAGDDLDAENLKFVVRKASSSAIVAQWKQGSWSENSSDANFRLVHNGDSTAFSESNYKDTTISTGDAVFIQVNASADISSSVPDDTDYSIQVYHTDSGSEITTATVRVE